MPIYSPTGFLDITNATLRTSNVEAENLLMTGGNIYVTSELETDATVLNLENVTRKGNVSSNTIEITNVTTGIIATGNVHASKFIGSGEYLTGIPPSAITGTLSQWSDGTNGDVYIAGNVGIANAHTLTSNTLQVGGNLYVRDTGSNVLTVNGNVVANYFEGDGSKLSGIVTDLQGVTDNGNVTTNVVQFSNATTGLVTTANIEVGGDLKIDGLSAGKIPYVAADKFLKDSFITTTGDTTVITSNLDVTGNIFMRGDKFIVHSESKLINDAIVGIANNNTVSTTDKGIIMQNTAGNVAIIHHGTGDGFANQLTFGYTDDPLDTITVTNDLTKELTVNVLGNVITQNNLSVGGTLSINNITAAAQHSLQAVTNVGNVTSNTVQFSNAITSLVASSNIVVTGNVSAGHDTNTTSYFGRAAVGYMGQDDQASFAHVDHNDPARYAIKQTAAGPTYINTPAAGHIRFTVNDGNLGAEKMRITSAGKVGVGVTSPDATLHVAGNAYVSSNLTVSGNATVSSNLIVDDSGASGNSRLAIGTTNLTHGIVVRKNTDTLLLESENAGANYPVNIDFKNYDLQNPVGARISAIDDTAFGSHIAFYTKEQDGNDATSAITEKMRILSNGSVGIGASAPNRLLHVETPTGTSENYIKIASGMNNGSAQSISGIEFQTNPQFYNGDNGVRIPARITSGFLNGPAGTANWADAYLSLLSTTSVSSAALTEHVTCRGGKVGIFTTSPQAELDVRTKLIAGDYGSSGYYNSHSRIHARNSNSTQITMEKIGTMTGGIGVMSSGTVVGSQGDVLMRGGSTHTDDFGSTGSYMGVFKHSGGDIVQFFKGRNGVADYFYYNTAGNYGHYSDRRGKTNIEPLNMSESVQYIKNLKPISFNYHNDPIGEHPQAGFIAQDVLAAQTNIAQTHAVVNNHKTYDENDPNCKELGISMHNIIPMITHTLQNILERLETLENKNA